MSTTKRNRGIVVFFPTLPFMGMQLKKGDEIDCIEHNIPPAKMIQLIKARRIGYGDILRSHEEIMGLDVPDQDTSDPTIRKIKRGFYNILDGDKPINPEPIKGIEKAREYLEEMKNG